MKTTKLALPDGVSRAKTGAFAQLIADITGAVQKASLPYLAPALMFSSPRVQSQMGVPQPGPDDVLLHDYQAIRYDAPLPLDRGLRASLTRKGHDYGIDIQCDDAPILRMDTALRIVARREVMEVKPTLFRGIERLSSLGLHQGLSVSQQQVDRYLALSGDSNPIHSDAAIARALGLAAPIVPGLLLVSTIQRACDSALSDASLVSLKARFMAPLCVGMPFQIALQDRGESDGSNRLRATLMTESAQALAVADMVFQTA